MSLGISELLVVGVAALLVFGGRLPDVMRNLGRTYAKFRHGMNEVAEPLRREIRRIDVRPSATSIPRRPTLRPEHEAEASPAGSSPEPEGGPEPSSPAGGGVADEPPPV
jgi:TatA/E family protein of Tat protein translocase